MTPAEAAKLLTIASAYDNRKPDADQARAWALILDDIRYEDAQVVVIEHFRRSRDWLMPVDIIGAVKRIRAKRIAEHPPVIPPEPTRTSRHGSPTSTAASGTARRSTLTSSAANSRPATCVS
jgi:hypothetical protein